jgi:geranylgeranyl diphosphate synthase type I
MTPGEGESAFLSIKEEVESELQAFMRGKIEQASDATIRGIVEMLSSYSRGGKRIRPVMLILGHDLFARHNEATVKASISIELSQSYFLIQDDIMDQSETRRGKPSFHMEVWNRLFHNDPERKRLAESIALVASDLAESYSHEAIFASGLDRDQALIADTELTSIFETTGHGQLIDIYSTFAENFTEADLIRLHTLKTARYTVEGPLVMGARIAGNASEIQNLESYGYLVGTAFQIQDDILGMFGDESVLGKSVKSDVNEGKKTLLILKALEQGSESERAFVRQCISSGNISDADFEKLKRIVESTGSLGYSRDLVLKMSSRAKDYLHSVNGDEKVKHTLAWAADYIVSRNK